MKEILGRISASLQKGKAKEVKTLILEALNDGIPALEILNDGLLAGINTIDANFKMQAIYVPEVLIAARAMKVGTDIIKPLLVDSDIKSIGRVILGTVRGDLHDIGKNLVGMMMEAKGIEVTDLGTDVEPERFISAAIEHNAQIVCCSALLTTTIFELKNVIEAAKKAGIRDKVKIMVGGAPVNADFARTIGADIFTSDASAAAEKAVAVLEGKF